MVRYYPERENILRIGRHNIPFLLSKITITCTVKIQSLRYGH